MLLQLVFLVLRDCMGNAIHFILGMTNFVSYSLPLFLFPSRTLSEITKFTCVIRNTWSIINLQEKKNHIINENTYNLFILFRRDPTSNLSLNNPLPHVDRATVNMSSFRTRLLGQEIIYVTDEVNSGMQHHFRDKFRKSRKNIFLSIFYYHMIITLLIF